MTDGRHISQEDLALQAMGVLANEECAAVRQHLDECAECRDQLAELRGDLALVAMAVEQQAAPAGARERFVERIAGSAAGAAAPALPQRPLRAPVIPMASRTKPARPASWVPWIAVAAMLVISAALGVKIYFLSQQLETEDALLRREERLIQSHNAEYLHARALLDLLNAPTAQHVMLTAGKTAPAPSARAVYLASKGALMLQASNMQPLPPNKTYELWVIPMQGAPIPAGTFRPDAAGSGSVVMPPMIPPGTAAKMFAITVEKAEGSATPTMPIVLSGAAASPGE